MAAQPAVPPLPRGVAESRYRGDLPPGGVIFLGHNFPFPFKSFRDLPDSFYSKLLNTCSALLNICSTLLNICSTLLNKNFCGENKNFQARRKNHQGGEETLLGMKEQNKKGRFGAMRGNT